VARASKSSPRASKSSWWADPKFESSERKFRDRPQNGGYVEQLLAALERVFRSFSPPASCWVARRNKRERHARIFSRNSISRRSSGSDAG
jgi:hypothetical protein